MVLSNRRLRTIYIALAGMEACVLSTYLLLLFQYEGARPVTGWLWQNAPEFQLLAPARLLMILWVGLLGMIVAVDLLAHSKLSDHVYRLAVVGLVLATALLAVRVLLYPGLGIFDLRWLVHLVTAALNFHQGLQPAFLGLLFSFFLWLRASALSSQAISFLEVGMRFRLGLLLLLIGAGALVVIRPRLTGDGIMLLSTYIGLGLVAVALTRSDEKAESSGSVGSTLPLARLAQLLFMVAATVGLAFVVAVLATPAQIRAGVGFFNPLWRLVGRLLLTLITVLLVILEWVVFWIYTLLAPLLANLGLTETLAQLAAQLTLVGEEPVNTGPPEPWPWAGLLLAALRFLVVGGGVTLILWLIYLLLARRRKRAEGKEQEVTSPAPPTLSDHALRRGWERLKHWANLVRQYGIGARLLDAITVENIYANLSRLARQRGHPRRPAHPPDQYLPALMQAFPDNDAALQRITAAYMRVHYGDRPVSGEELARLRRDYENIHRKDAKDAKARKR